MNRSRGAPRPSKPPACAWPCGGWTAWWRLLAREHNRPFDHYSAIFAPPLAFDNRGACQTPGTVLEPSPLLGTELPGVDAAALPGNLQGLGVAASAVGLPAPPAERPRIQAALHQTNVTPQRRALLADLSDLPAALMLAIARHRPAATLRHDLDACPEHRDPGSMAASGACAEPGIPGQGIPQKQTNPLSNTGNTNPIGQFNNDFNMRDNYRSKLQGEQGQLSHPLPTSP